jgi:surface-anchored protein
MKYSILPLAMVLTLSNATITRADLRYLGEGHTDLAIDYDDAAHAWNFHVGSDSLAKEFAPDQVILKVKSGALTNVPSAAAFSFLGTPGSPIWILPQQQNEELLYLGYGGDGIPNGVFEGNQVTVALKSVTGPGDFFSYRLDSFGNPQVLFNTANGISTDDAATVQSGGDAHLNWAFSQPGDYTVVLEASGILASDKSVSSSGAVSFRFSVGAGPKVLDAGHTDLALDYTPDEDAWDFHVGSDALEEGYDADDVILQVNGDANTSIPPGPLFAFLGNSGDPVWILPQAQNPALLYLGYGGDGIPEDVFASNRIKVALKSVTGPGDFFSYSLDSFGNPHVLFNTRDGISSNDVAAVQAGGDAHLNWAFTQPGDYKVTLQASGELDGAATVTSSGLVTFSFSVLPPPVILTNEHVDLRIVYDPSATHQLSIVARDEDHQISYATNEAILVVNEGGKLTLPAGTPFGNEGDSLWVIPQSQNPDLLYLGISAEGIPSGAFTGNLEFRLTSVEGPGQFIVWQAVGFGNYNVVINTKDGITAQDETTPLIGSHEHYNWGFTTNGIYKVTFEASGHLAGSTNITSLPETFTFHVLPLPTNASPVEIQIQNPRMTLDGSFVFDLAGDVSELVEVQESSDLRNWQMTNAAIRSSQTITIPFDLKTSCTFYRVLQK